MKTYIISIAVATVICSVMNTLTPDKWEKYVSVVTGLVLTVCIARPMISLVNHEALSNVSYTVENTKTDGEEILHTQIRTELEKRINNDIRNRLKSNFARDCTAQTSVSLSESGTVTGVQSITVYGDKIDSVIIGELREIYGAREVRYGGIKKTAQKSE